MKKSVFILLVLTVCMVAISCQKENKSKNNTEIESGYAPTLEETKGKTFKGLSAYLFFEYNGTSWTVRRDPSWYDASFHITSSSVNYTKNSANGATFTYDVSFSDNAGGIPWNGSSHGSLSLTFTSPSGGTATGTKDDNFTSSTNFTLM